MDFQSSNLDAAYIESIFIDHNSLRATEKESNKIENKIPNPSLIEKMKKFILDKFIAISQQKQMLPIQQKSDLIQIDQPQNNDKNNIEEIKGFISCAPGFITKKITEHQNPSDKNETIKGEGNLLVRDLKVTDLEVSKKKLNANEVKEIGCTDQETYDFLAYMKDEFTVPGSDIKGIGEDGVINMTRFLHQGLASKIMVDWMDKNEAKVEEYYKNDTIFMLHDGTLKTIGVEPFVREGIPCAKFTAKFIFPIRFIDKNNLQPKDPLSEKYICIQKEIIIPLEELKQNWEETKDINEVMPGLQVIDYESEEVDTEEAAVREVDEMILLGQLETEFPPKHSQIKKLQNLIKSPHEDNLNVEKNELIENFDDQSKKNINAFFHEGMVPNIAQHFENQAGGGFIQPKDIQTTFLITELENSNLIKFTIKVDCQLNKYDPIQNQSDQLGYATAQRDIFISRDQLEKNWTENKLENPHVFIVDHFGNIEEERENINDESINSSIQRMNALLHVR